MQPDVDAISKAAQEKHDTVVLYADEKVRENMEAVIFLKDLCSEGEKKLYLVGYNDDIDELRKVVPEKLITGTLERPLNVKLLVEKLEQQMKEAEKEERKKHILVVDDSGTMLRTIKSWLTPKYHVSMASSGTMAISFLATNKPDLILLDYEMPICSGPQFMEMIHSEVATEHIPVMFLTAKGDRESVKKVLELKPVGYLLKTMPPEEIVKSIDAFFKKK